MIFGRCPRRRRSEPSLGVFTRRDVHGRAELEVEIWHSGGGVGSTCVFFCTFGFFSVALHLNTALETGQPSIRHVRTVGWTTYLGMEEDWSSSGVMIPVLLLQRFLGVCPCSISSRV